MFYIQEIATGFIHGKYRWDKKPYTQQGAKAVCTKMNKTVGHEKWKIIAADEYNNRPKKMVERINLMTGQPYMEAEDTPNFCSPASEAYWSM